MSLRALLALLIAAAGPAAAQQPSKEAAAVAAQVAAKADWVADAALCPTQVMPRREIVLQTVACKPGGFEACLSRCSSGSGFHCYWLAYALQMEGIGLPAYEPLYQRACKLGVMSGCTNRAAGMLMEKKGDPATDACAAATFAKVCAFDDPWACTMYASFLARGVGVKQDKAAALKALEKSCKFGPSDEACTYGMRIKNELLGGAKPPS